MTVVLISCDLVAQPAQSEQEKLVNHRRERERRTVVPGLAALTPLTLNMVWASERISWSGIFVGTICAKRPVILSMPGTVVSPRLENFPLPWLMMGRNFCFWPPCDSPMRTMTSCRSNDSDGGSVMSIFSPGVAVFIQASSAMTVTVAAWAMHTSRAVPKVAMVSSVAQPSWATHGFG